jgi:hypothetical protein
MRTNPAQLELELKALLATPAPRPTKTPEELEADLAEFVADPEAAHVSVNPYEVKQAARRDRLQRGSERARREAETAHGAATRIWGAIPMGQPILVGHHSERRHRRDLSRADRAMRKSVEADKLSKKLAGRAAAVGPGGISSDDPKAEVKLRAELAGLQRRQDEWKNVNAAIRKHAKAGRLAQLAALTALGLPKGVAENLLEPDFAGRIGIADYQLKNNNANMRRIEQRIKELTVRDTSRPREVVTGELQGIGYELYENRESNRVQILFAGKPGPDVRAQLKSAGFRWAPTEGVWQRQLSNQAWHQAQRVLGVLAP